MNTEMQIQKFKDQDLERYRYRASVYLDIDIAWELEEVTPEMESWVADIMLKRMQRQIQDITETRVVRMYSDYAS